MTDQCSSCGGFCGKRCLRENVEPSGDAYGDGTVYRGVRSKDSSIKTIDLTAHEYKTLWYAATAEIEKLQQRIAELKAALEQPQEEQEWLTGCPECGMDGGCDCPSGTYNPPASPKCKQCGDTLASASTELCYGCQQEGMQ